VGYLNGVRGKAPAANAFLHSLDSQKRVSWQHFKFFTGNGNGCYKIFSFTLWP